MRRRPVFVLLLFVFAALLVGCGGDDSADPTKIVDRWSQAITGGDDEKAAALFAPDALVIQDGRRTTLKDEAAALTFNSSLPCGYKVVEQKVTGSESTATFTLTRRPGHMCDGTGEPETVVLRITDEKITLWHQLPPGTTDSQAA
jgi:hypothetical protein